MDRAPPRAGRRRRRLPRRGRRRQEDRKRRNRRRERGRGRRDDGGKRLENEAEAAEAAQGLWRRFLVISARTVSE